MYYDNRVLTSVPEASFEVSSELNGHVEFSPGGVSSDFLLLTGGGGGGRLALFFFEAPFFFN